MSYFTYYELPDPGVHPHQRPVLGDADRGGAPLVLRHQVFLQHSAEEHGRESGVGGVVRGAGEAGHGPDRAHDVHPQAGAHPAGRLPPHPQVIELFNFDIQPENICCNTFNTCNIFNTHNTYNTAHIVNIFNLMLDLIPFWNYCFCAL